MQEAQNVPFYRIKSSTTLSFITVSDYTALLKKYDEDLLKKMQTVHSALLGTRIYIIEVGLEPENMHWIIWKNKDEIMEFLANFQIEMENMTQVPERLWQTGKKIEQDFRSLHSNVDFSPQYIERFIAWLNLVGDHPYLRKTIEFLLFIEHCVSLDKWNVLVYQQLYIFKAPTFGNKVAGFFCSGGPKQNEKKDYFLSVTSDGILKSDDHLMLSRVQKMVPFTNQIEINPQITQGNLSYHIESGRSQNFIVNFYSDYVRGINFGAGLGRAMIDSSYKQAHRFNSYSQRRSNCASKFYNDGAGYFEDLYDELMKAEKQVCQTGWMITPYFQLKRPNHIENKDFRLDGVYQQLANRGVKIYIIVFMEPAMFVNNDSEHVQHHMESLHPNIKVVRHPNNAIPILWSHHEKMVIIDQKVGFMGGLDVCYGRWDTPEHFLSDPSLLWDGCDYNNYKIKDVYEPRKYKESNLNRALQPRMPWHDIALQIRGDCVIDLLRHFVQYWYFVRSELNMDAMKVVGQMKKRIQQAANHTEQAEINYLKHQMKENNEQTMAERIGSYKKKLGVLVTGEEERLSELFIEQRDGFNVGPESIQLCRSASEWSIGVKKGHDQCSIHNAYLNLIENSEHFIYIENQFFMGLENKIVETLSNRIKRAHQNHESYRVVVVMPLLPGFEGDIADPASTVLRIQVHWEYQAILRGKESLYARLKPYVPNIEDYIFFYGLRKAQFVGSVPVTEIIYVHSKLMIVDDKRVIIGSANINDRSLLGTRDSQIAAIIEEDPTLGQTNAQNLRIRLFNEHFGLTPQETLNFMNPSIWAQMINAAKSNTVLYRQCFGCVPDDNVTVAAEVPKLEQQANRDMYSQIAHKIKAHAVEFPLYFMKDEDLTFKPNQKEYFAPDMSFT